MINTSLILVKINSVKPKIDTNIANMIIPPTERVKSFSPEQFEEFILEWAVACAKTIYKDVYRIGGAGDMGRDVIAEYENGEYDYYQCKRYEGKLMPSEYWIEFGKLCYYTYNKDIPIPKKYYIIASQGLGPKMLSVIKDSENIREGLIANWNEKCKTKISKGKEINLDKNLLDYIKKFDFTIVDTYSIDKIIEEHRKTDYFYFRFGGINKPKRGMNLNVPDNVYKNELTYIRKVFDAYSENKNKIIDMSNIDTYSNLERDFNRQRVNFYSAESLKQCVREIFSSENEFEKLKKEMHSGIIEFIEDEFEDGYERLKRTMHEATKVNLSVSILDSDLHFICNDDKKGLCHQLANDDDNKIEWRNSI